MLLFSPKWNSFLKLHTLWPFPNSHSLQDCWPLSSPYLPSSIWPWWVSHLVSILRPTDRQKEPTRTWKPHSTVSLPTISLPGAHNVSGLNMPTTSWPALLMFPGLPTHSVSHPGRRDNSTIIPSPSLLIPQGLEGCSLCPALLRRSQPVYWWLPLYLCTQLPTTSESLAVF